MSENMNVSLLVERMEEFSRIFRKLNKEILDYYGLSESAIFIFGLLKNEEMTLKDLTELSKLDKSTVSRQVDALVRKKLLTKKDGQDKRKVLIQMTDQAFHIYERYRKEADLAFDDLLSGWSSEEKQQLSILLYRANRSFKEMF